MFVELMPLLASRSVMITVARENQTTIRVHVLPKRTKDDENPALCTPLSYIGTPEELDAELGKHLAAYVECHQQLGSTLAQAKSEMEAAAKAAREEADKKAAERKKKAAEKQDEKSAPITPAAPANPTSSMSLFACSQPTTESERGASKTKSTEEEGGETSCRLAL